MLKKRRILNEEHPGFLARMFSGVAGLFKWALLPVTLGIGAWNAVMWLLSWLPWLVVLCIVIWVVRRR